MSHDEIQFMKLMQAKGFRVTPQRLLILDAVCAGKGHSTLGAITARVKEWDATIDTSTIYRTLDFLCEQGLVTATEISGGKVYEIVEATPHHHLVCQSCGAILQINDGDIRPLIENITTKYGFRVTANHLALVGICAACQQKIIP